MSPKTTPMLPSAKAQKPEVTFSSLASVGETLTVMEMRTLLRVGLIQAAAYRRFVPACQLHNLSSGNLPRDDSPCRRERIFLWYYGSTMVVLRLQIGRDRRIFPHQRDGHAPVCRQRGVVGKQGLVVRLARDRIDVRRRQALTLQDLTHRVGAIGRKVEGAIVAAQRHEA